MDLKISSNGVAVLGKKSSCKITEKMTSAYLTARLSDIHLAGAKAKHLILLLGTPPIIAGVLTTKTAINAATPDPKE